MRVRYGAYGENWTDPDPGAVSALGYPAEYKLIEDPLLVENSAHWGNISCGLFAYLDGSVAQTPVDMEEWSAVKGEMEAKSRELFEEARSHDPETICPYLSYTIEEQEKLGTLNYPVYNLVRKYEQSFIQGVPEVDIHKDEDWDTFLGELESLNLTEYAQIVQTAYERH